ncbi:Oidioi.mRNA.OKI2018_I69.chr2.g4661.t1.cds [Oikopleura dioica]|uniref:Oidioi.mRNA.OKI2018_I69.chr2.g4661.t1.cds n=1 Tax=Oikopleura dioica TaxID=34765 RepID=A0ABN7SXM9_OIKDI|nr:Oidioi.mRNA.OKI2018_I69.chr2.g4661.t1.cds [Oikopleura dioica]
MKLFAFFTITAAGRTRRNVSTRPNNPLTAASLSNRSGSSCKDFAVPEVCCTNGDDSACNPGSCWCDSLCCGYGDCCADYDEGQCAAQLGTCFSQSGTTSCQSGFYFDGSGCSDTNECEDGTDNCNDVTEVCNNTAGSYECVCASGYEASSGGCTDVNECVAGTDTCNDVTEVCNNNAGSYTCSCAAGYEASSNGCVDVNECVAGTDTCDDASEVCYNTDGGFTCSCASGYEASSSGCVDVNECVAGTDRCNDVTEVCNNVAGSYTCSCAAGYVANRGACVKSTTCLEDTNFGDVLVWDIQSGVDKPAPTSYFEFELADFAGNTEDCQRECANHAGCYKLHHDVNNNVCELRGNEVDFSGAGNYFALSGESCDTGYVWTENVADAVFYCLFWVDPDQTPEEFLEYLNTYNPTEWYTYTTESYAYSETWKYSVPADTSHLDDYYSSYYYSSYSSENTVWVQFHMVYHDRYQESSSSRNRRSTQETLDAVQDSIANFQSSLDAGNATVAQTTDATVNVEEVAPVADPMDPNNQAWEKIASKAAEISSRVEDFYAALPGLGNNSVLGSKKAYQFNLFFDQMSLLKKKSSATGCTFPAGSNDFSQFVAPVDSSDVCEEMQGLFTSLSTFVDSFVCLNDEKAKASKFFHILHRNRKKIFEKKLRQMNCGNQ